MKNHIMTSVKVLVILTLLLGLIYPLSITGVAQTFFPDRANGSLVELNGKIIGSTLLAQKTVSEKYFWPRPSASDYGANPSGASNLGPTSKVLKQAVEERRARGFSKELLFTSASGLDPHISIDAALSQVQRIVQSRLLSEDSKNKIVDLVHRSVEGRDFGVFGEPRINVLHLNMELDRTFSN
jgi:potassium-transporting ATPase KdpC subunit